MATARWTITTGLSDGGLLLAFPSREGGTVGDGRVEANYGFTVFELRIKVSLHKVTLSKDALALLLIFVGLMWVLLFRLVPRHLPC